MAKRTVTTYFDDIDGNELPKGEAVTIPFALDGKEYSLDVSRENAERFYDTFAPYIKVARRTNGMQGKPPKRIQGPILVVPSQEVRRWAAENGYTVADRGKIPEDVNVAFNNATKEK